MSDGFSSQILYLLTTGKHVKIGVSADVPSRIRSIQTGNPLPVQILRTWHHPRARLVEQTVLSACSLAVTSGEWLALAEYLAIRIVEVVIAGFEVRSVEATVTPVQEKPLGVLQGEDGCFYGNLPLPKGWMDHDVVATSATGARFVGRFKGFWAKWDVDCVGNLMRTLPQGWSSIECNKLIRE